MDPIVLFFLFGLVAGLIGCQIKFHSAISEFLTILLLLSIGIKGGVELHGQDLIGLLPAILGVASLGLVIPLLAFPIIHKVGKLTEQIQQYWRPITALSVLEPLQYAWLF